MKSLGLPIKFILATSLLLAAFVVSQAQGKSRVYGPYPSSSDDSGTCGQTWAHETFDRYFHVTLNADGSTTVIEQFKRGSFTTVAGPSPGACEGGGNNGHTVAAGITGEFQGKFTIIVLGFTFNPDAVPTCNTVGCVTTKSFIEATFLGAIYPSANANVPSFLFNYNAGPNGDWKNASADKGGNEGDITSTP